MSEEKEEMIPVSQEEAMAFFQANLDMAKLRKEAAKELERSKPFTQRAFDATVRVMFTAIVVAAGTGVTMGFGWVVVFIATSIKAMLLGGM